jgi:hypothetical protein
LFAAARTKVKKKFYNTGIDKRSLKMPYTPLWGRLLALPASTIVGSCVYHSGKEKMLCKIAVSEIFLIPT